MNEHRYETFGHKRAKSQCSMLVLIFLKSLLPFGFISDCFSAKKERFPCVGSLDI